MYKWKIESCKSTGWRIKPLKTVKVDLNKLNQLSTVIFASKTCSVIQFKSFSLIVHSTGTIQSKSKISESEANNIANQICPLIYEDS